MGFVQDYEELIMTERGLFQKICRVFLKQTFIVCDRNEESRKMYFFVRKHQEMFSEYFQYMGFDIAIDQDNKVTMLKNQKNDGLQSNRLRFRKYESIVLCCLWTIYVDQVREGNLTRPILITVFDLRQAMEKYGVKEDMEGKGILRDTLELFSRYQLVGVNGEIGNPDCTIRLYSSLQFALELEEFKQFVIEADNRMQESRKMVDLLDDEEFAEEDDES